MWDRFDDAMDDQTDGEHALRQENANHEKELVEPGGSVPPSREPEEQPVRDGSYIEGRYQNELRLWNYLRERNAALKELLHRTKNAG